MWPLFAAGALIAATGVGWFLGTIAGWAVLVHRATFAQLIVTYT
jgi:hypothetical protein